MGAPVLRDPEPRLPPLTGLSGFWLNELTK